MTSRKLMVEEHAKLLKLVREVDTLADRLKVRFQIKKADAYSYLNSLAPVGTKLFANAEKGVLGSASSKKASSTLALVESIHEKLMGLQPSHTYRIEEAGLTDFIDKYGEWIANLKAHCIELIQSLEAPETEEAEIWDAERAAASLSASAPLPQAEPLPDGFAPAHHALYQVADLAYFDVAVPSRNYNPEEGLPIYGSFIFNVAQFAAKDGGSYRLTLDTCILQTELANGEVPVLARQEVVDDTGKRLKLISERAYPLPHNPKWRLEAPEQHVGLEGSFRDIRLCNVNGRIEPGECMSMAAPVSSITVSIDGVELQDRSKADAVLKQWLKLTTLGKARAGQYPLGSKPLVEDESH